MKHQLRNNTRETRVATTEASGLVDTHDEPSPGIVLTLEGT